MYIHIQIYLSNCDSTIYTVNKAIPVLIRKVQEQAPTGPFPFGIWSNYSGSHISHQYYHYRCRKSMIVLKPSEPAKREETNPRTKKFQGEPKPRFQ